MSEEIKKAAEQLSCDLSRADTLVLRLKSRSRTEYFYPGSLAPELLRRSEEELEALMASIRAYRDLVESAP